MASRNYDFATKFVQGRADRYDPNARVRREAEERRRAREEQAAEAAQRPRSIGFSADFDTGRMTDVFAMPAGNVISVDRSRAVSPQQQMFDEVGGLIQKGNAARKQKRDMSQAMLGSALVYSRGNKGFMPPDMVQAFNAQTGMNIIGGNYTADGNYVLYAPDEIVDARGKRITSGRISPAAVITPEMQYQALRNSGLGVDEQRRLYDHIAKATCLTPTQLAERGIVRPADEGDLGAAQAARGLMSGGSQQGGMDVGQMMKLHDMLQKQRSAIAERNPADPRLAQLDAKSEKVFAAIMGVSGLSDATQAGGEVGAPKVENDEMVLTDGRRIRKDQEFVVKTPDGAEKRLIWRGGTADNVEEIEG